MLLLRQFGNPIILILIGAAILSAFLGDSTDVGIIITINGVGEGRRTFANTLKYVFIATSANIGKMFSMADVSLFLPLLRKQILLITAGGFSHAAASMGASAWLCANATKVLWDCGRDRYLLCRRSRIRRSRQERPPVSQSSTSVTHPERDNEL